MFLWFKLLLVEISVTAAANIPNCYSALYWMLGSDPESDTSSALCELTVRWRNSFLELNLGLNRMQSIIMS